MQAAVGNDGLHCARWREITLRLNSEPLDEIFLFFGYETPHLRVLTLQEFSYYITEDESFLPSTPLLQDISLLSCYLSKLPDTSNATKLCITGYYNPTSAKSLEDAQKLRDLELDSIEPETYKLPLNLLYLERLSLAGGSIPMNMELVQTPVLRELAIKPIGLEPVQNLLKCGGLPFSQLTTITVSFGRYYPKNDEAPWMAYEALLRACSNARRIVGDEGSTLFLLKLLRDDCVGARNLDNLAITVGYKPSISYGAQKSKELRVGKDERLLDIDEFAAELKWPHLSQDWTTFTKLLYGYLKGAYHIY